MVGIKKLEKGDLLIREGEQSASMYWLQSGSLRLFKKKGNGFIELGVLHSGELVGEMSFLDDQPRSASVEALSKCDLIEIPRGKFDEVMKTLPSWLNSLVQTLVKRLRTTNNRLKEIENASTVYKQDEMGRTVKQHEFISTNELLRMCSALLLVATRKGEVAADRSVKIRATWVHIFAGNIAQIPVAKVSTFLETLNEAGVVRMEKDKDQSFIHVYSTDFLDRFITWAYDENLKPDEKRLPVTAKGVIICDMIYQYGNLASFGVAEQAPVDMAKVFQQASAAMNTNLPFELSSFQELVKAGLATELTMSQADEKVTQLQLAKFRQIYPCLNLRQRFLDLNEEKRSPG